MKKTALVIFALLVGAFCPFVSADPIHAEFASRDLLGTLVVASAAGEVVHVHNEQRSEIRFSPASTFKIPNTLIGLKYGVVDSRNSPFLWDGVDRANSAWNRDQDLQSAFRVSCVWCYQEIARQIGTAAYISELAAIDYGNGRVGPQVEAFWLNGELTISAVEQVGFLQQLYAGDLPFRTEHTRELRTIMLEEENGAYSLFAKSGWTGAGMNIGWYVGYVETSGGAWMFALNMDMSRIEQAPYRKQIVLLALAHLGLIETPSGGREGTWSG